MRKIQKAALREIVTLLRENPQNWTFSEHAARYENLKIEVWISNRYYGTKFSYGSIHSGGNVNVFWFLKPWQWWRVSLIKEVEQSQAKQMGLVV